MDGVPLLYEVPPILHQLRAVGVEMHYHPTRKYLRCLVIFFTFLFFMLLVYIPMFHSVRSRDDPVHAVSIAGWAHNRSRDLRLYVLPDNATAIIAQPDLCGQQLFLLIVVCSAVTNFEARAAIRETWASVASTSNNNTKTVKVAFLLGDPDNSTLQEQVEEESIRHGDVIQEGFIDSYNNLTLKTVMMLKWVHSYCTSAHFIMKTDDDMFVNINNLIKLLKVKGGPGLLLGTLICGAKPILDANSKWYSPRYMYAGRVYPNYVSGTGYVMAADVAQNLYRVALRTPLFHLEDVYLTGVCARKAGIRPRDYPGFTYGHRRMDPCVLNEPSVITSHRVDMTEMRKVWTRMHSPSLDCTAFAASQKPTSKASGKKVVSVRRPGNRCV
ncbi:beta-1,3-galactosyltransferase 1 isoform X2 [Anabrus simplex]